MEAFHGQQACLSLLGVLLRGFGSGEGFAIQGGEAGLSAQEAGHEEVEEGPQLQHVVLDGGASQDEAVASHQGLACLQRASQRFKTGPTSWQRQPAELMGLV